MGEVATSGPMVAFTRVISSIVFSLVKVSHNSPLLRHSTDLTVKSMQVSTTLLSQNVHTKDSSQTTCSRAKADLRTKMGACTRVTSNQERRMEMAQWFSRTETSTSGSGRTT